MSLSPEQFDALVKLIDSRVRLADGARSLPGLMARKLSADEAIEAAKMELVDVWKGLD